MPLNRMQLKEAGSVSLLLTVAYSTPRQIVVAVTVFNIYIIQ